MSNLIVAKTILEQLGGNKFRVMTGAKNFVGTDNSISFKLPRFTGLKITHVRITLNSLDLYDIEFLNIRGSNMKVIEKNENIYCNQLQHAFTSATGLDTHL